MMGIPSENIANFDETNVDFAMDAPLTLNRCGEKTISVRKLKSSDRVTAMIGCSMTGEKIKPFLIFKGKPGARIEREFTSSTSTFPNTLKYAVQKKHGWMRQQCFLGSRTYGYHGLNQKWAQQC